MPVCRECGIMQANAEMRRSKKEEGTWVCKDKDPCKLRRAAQRANEIALRKGARR